MAKDQDTNRGYGVTQVLLELGLYSPSKNLTVDKILYSDHLPKYWSRLASKSYSQGLVICKKLIVATETEINRKRPRKLQGIGFSWVILYTSRKESSLCLDLISHHRINNLLIIKNAIWLVSQHKA